MDNEVPLGEPTPEKIRQKCLEIQREWSDTVRETRAAYKHQPARIQGADKNQIKAALKSYRRDEQDETIHDHP